MGFIKRLKEKFGRKKRATIGTSTILTDSMQETLKAYKVRADMIEKYKSVTALTDHREEYKQRLAAEPMPSWELGDIIIARLKLAVALYPPDPTRFTAPWRERLDKMKEGADAET